MLKYERFLLSGILYYRIGGTARYLLEARDRDDVLQALDFVRGERIDRLVIVGQGANLLFPDGEFDGAVLRMAAGGQNQIRELQGGVLESFAGEDLDALIQFGFARGNIGLEWAGGLPGTVGAAVRGNVGAFGGELKDVLASAELLEITDGGYELRRFDNADLGFAYRESIVKRNRKLIVISARFGMPRAGQDALTHAREVYHSNIQYRNVNHPMDCPTCGSTFKNISDRGQVEKVLAVWPDVGELVERRWYGKVSVGYVINRLGLTGYRTGGAQISPKHSNFIVNLGNASFDDVYGIIQEVKEQFIQAFGFAPEPEVEIVGQDL